ncbi:MAG: hypothetical protein WCJ58_02140 [bacterium]
MASIFEAAIQEYAITDPGKSLWEAPIAEIFSKFELDYLTKGSSSRVYKIKAQNWLVKEGRWDLDIDLIGKLRLAIPASSVEKLLNQFQMSFLPTKEQIKEQLARYFELVKYLGYSEDLNSQNHNFFPVQKRIRSRLIASVKEYIADEKLYQKICDYFSNREITTNFLVKEYLLFGKSLSPENKNKLTYFIIQEFVAGKTLHDFNLKDSDAQVKSRLIEFCLMLLLLNKEKNLIPDTRPRFLLTEGFDWLGKTDNIIITPDNQLKFIDTRLIWNIKDNFIKRGLFIPVMTERVVRDYLRKLL